MNRPITVLDWLQTGDASVARMTRMKLLDQPFEPFVKNGWIRRFLDLYDSSHRGWEGIYGPKWVSTFYTLRDLVALEVDPNLPEIQEALSTLLSKMWGRIDSLTKDVCVVAMFLDMLAYAGRLCSHTDQMVDYLLQTRLPDGGWNCDMRKKNQTVGSIHTTCSVLEGFHRYLQKGGTHRMDEIQESILTGREYLLRKHLFKRERDGEIMFPSITDAHFPTRWKYDVLRGLMLFEQSGVAYDARMEDALLWLEAKMKKGLMPRGSAYSGRLHFTMETQRFGRMNTLHALMALKKYKPNLYEHLIAADLTAVLA
jgi:hypothetical protein